MKTIAIDINEVIRDYLNSFKKQYQKNIDPSFDIEYDNINDFNLLNIFPFLDEDGYPWQRALDVFRFEEQAFEIYSRADVMERNMIANVNLWLNNNLRNLEEKNPHVIFFSPFEVGLAVPSTLGFLARIGLHARHIEFPIDSTKMWDKCDIMITANPNLLSMTPEDKVSIKIAAPYNKEAKGTYEFDGLMDVIRDPENTLINILKK